MIKAWTVRDSSGMLAWFHLETEARAFAQRNGVHLRVDQRDVNPKIFHTVDERGGYLFPFYTSL